MEQRQEGLGMKLPESKNSQNKERDIINLQERVLLFLENNSKGAEVSLQDIEDDPYRILKQYGNREVLDNAYDILSQINRARNSEGLPEDKLLIEELRQKMLSFLDKIEATAKEAEIAIEKMEAEIFEAKVAPEMEIDELATIKNIVKINRNTAEIKKEHDWSLEKISKMSTEELVGYINEHGSGRYFKHSFPEASIRNGCICTARGGKNFTEGFRSVRDGQGGIDIDFTCENTDHEQEGFYGSIDDIGGGILIPAEVILENYGFINLPYREDGLNSSEWRMYGSPHNSHKELHTISLKCGVCFISEEFREKSEELFSKLAPEDRPNKVIYFSGEEHVALREFLARLKKPEELPKVSKVVKIIDEIKGISVFGTNRVERLWNS